MALISNLLFWILIPISYDILTERKVIRVTVYSILITIFSYAIAVAIALSPIMPYIDQLLYGKTS